MYRELMVAVILVLAVIRHDAKAEPPERLGEFGSPERIVFQGQRTYTEKQLRDALRVAPRMMIASDPNERLDDFLEQIQKQVKLGYLYSGFANATVTSKFDETLNSVVVSIEENRRYVKGNVEITGAKSVSSEQIRQYLTETRPLLVDTLKLSNVTPPTKKLETSQYRTQGPIWTAGNEVSFDERTRQLRERRLHRFFKECGYFAADLHVELRPEDDGTATLTITINDEGPQAQLASIEVIGNKKNTKDEIVEYLGLVIGSRLTSAITQEAEAKLRASARFLVHDVEIINPSDPNDQYGLKITVSEFEDAPALKEEFTPIQQAAVNVANWLDGLTHSEDDLIVEFQARRSVDAPAQDDVDNRPKSISFRAVISPHREEALFNVGFISSLDTEFDLTLMARQKSFQIDSATSKVCCELPFSAYRVIINIGIKSHAQDRQGNTSKLTFGMGLATESKNAKSALRIVCDPVCGITAVQKLVDQFKLEGDRLVFRDNEILDEEMTFSFDAKSGRLLDSLQVFSFDRMRSELTLKTGPGLYDRVLEEHSNSIKDWERFRIQETPFSSIIALLATISPRRTPDGKPRLLDLAHRWKPLEQIDQLFGVPQAVNQPVKIEDEFEIPADETVSNFMALFGPWVFPIINEVIPEKSSIRPVLQEFAFRVLGSSPKTNVGLKALLETPQLGPIGCLVGSGTFGFLSPNLGLAFAQQGRKVMELRDFQRDYEPFLADDTLTGRAILSLGKLLQNCNDEDTGAIADLLFLEPATDRETALKLLRHFSHHIDQPIQKSIPHVLDELWEPILKPLLIEQFANEREKT